jgi:hypothetical protein
MGYPELIEDPTLWGTNENTCAGFTIADADTARGWAGDLNATLGYAVDEVNALPANKRNGVHLTFIDPVTGQSNTGILPSDPYLFEPSSGIRHELCSQGNDAWLNGVSDLHPLTRSFHPNQQGATAMGNLAAEVIRNLTWSWSTTKDTQNPSPSCDPGALAAAAGHWFDSIGAGPGNFLLSVYCQGQYGAGIFGVPGSQGNNGELIFTSQNGSWTTVFAGSAPPDSSDGVPLAIQDQLLRAIFYSVTPLTTPIPIPSSAPPPTTTTTTTTTTTLAPPPATSNAPGAGFNAALQQWLASANVPAAIVGNNLTQAVADLNGGISTDGGDTSGYAGAIEALTSLMSVPPTDVSPQLQAQAQADIAALDAFFNTPGLSPNI